MDVDYRSTMGSEWPVSNCKPYRNGGKVSRG